MADHSCMGLVEHPMVCMYLFQLTSHKVFFLPPNQPLQDTHVSISL
ncbi:MAG: hypothetical protein HZB76_00765 [Chlamydiae bacterium]|nr:hypothetical protein [Chlamydiota bacterium]